MDNNYARRITKSIMSEYQKVNLLLIVKIQIF